MTKTKLFFDKDRADQFKGSVTLTMQKCNQLIKIFNSYQGFCEIVTLQEAESLLLGPVGFYDMIILKNVKISDTKGLEINVAKLCELYGINRAGFLSELGIPDSDCVDCHKPKVKEKDDLIDFVSYEQFSKYMKFENGFFIQNDEAINEKIKTFEIYTSSERQIELYQHYEQLFEVLKKHYEYGFIGPVALQTILQTLGNPYRLVDNKLYMNDIIIAGLISKAN